MLELLRDWTIAFGSISTVAGPIFDHDANGLRDTDYVYVLFEYKTYESPFLH